MADLLFESVEGNVEWLEPGSASGSLYYTRLTDTALQGFEGEDDVMPSDYVTLADYSEAALDGTDASGATFFLVPIPEEGADERLFRAADAEEAAYWVKAINDILAAVPLADEEGEDSRFEQHQQQQEEEVDNGMGAAYGRDVSGAQSSREGLAHPPPSASPAMPPPVVSTRLQPQLEAPTPDGHGGYHQTGSLLRGGASPSHSPERAESRPYGGGGSAAAPQHNTSTYEAHGRQTSMLSPPAPSPSPPRIPTSRAHRTLSGEEPNGLTHTPRAGYGGPQPPSTQHYSQQQQQSVTPAHGGMPAIRTTTVTTHDEYRQGGVPQSRYEETDAWVRGTAAHPTPSGLSGGDYGGNNENRFGRGNSGGGYGGGSGGSGFGFERGGSRSDAHGAGRAAVGGVGSGGQNNNNAYGREYSNAQSNDGGAGGHHGGGWGGQSPTPFGGAGGRGGYDDRGAPLRPRDPNGSHPPHSQSPIYPTHSPSFAKGGGYGDGHHHQQQQQQMRRGGAADVGNDTSFGNDHHSAAAAAVLGRKRSGMFVNMPSNQQMNTSVAPNVSAMWKAWVDPSGDTYVMHEPTKTLQIRAAGSDVFETFVPGDGAIPEEDLAQHPYPQPDDTICDINGNVVRNVQNYGTQRYDAGGAATARTSADIYRSDAVVTPRGAYSPTRKSRVTVAAAPRERATFYEGRRVHHVTIAGGGTSGDVATVEHSVEPLNPRAGLVWDPRTGTTVDISGAEGEKARSLAMGQDTLFRQWQHVRQVLQKGRYFKKHAVNKASFSYRFAFLTGDNAYVVCVPTSEVMLNVHMSLRTFENVADTIQYYGRDAKAIALNNVTRVTLGSDESSISRRKDLRPENTFCIVTRTHAFVLECETRKEASYMADAWNFLLFHSHPTDIQAMRTKQMRNPVTHGTRAGLAF